MLTNAHSSMHIYLTIVFFIFLLVPALALSGLEIAKTSSSDIRVVWYFFSLAFVATLVVVFWGESVGALDGQGNYHGEYGDKINQLLYLMLDLNTEYTLCAAILALLLIPQMISYVLSGLYGCAAAPLLVNGSIRLFVWAVVKPLVIAGGIVLAGALYGYTHDWSDVSAVRAIGWAVLSFTCVQLALLMLAMYHGLHTVLAQRVLSHFLQAERVLLAVHRWFTRATR